MEAGYSNYVGRILTLEQFMRDDIMMLTGDPMGFSISLALDEEAAAAETNFSVQDAMRELSKDVITESILKMADKLKRVVLAVPAITEAAAMSAGTNNSVKDAVQALRRMQGGGDSGRVEFQNIVEILPLNDLKTLEKLLEVPYHMMLGSEMGLNYYNPYPYPYPYLYGRPEVKPGRASGGGGNSFVTKYAGQAIGVMVGKVAGSAVFGAFEAPTFLEPLEKAAGMVGLFSVLGGMMLQDKKPGLSRAMIKFGSVAIALAMIVPMAANLDNPIMAWVFGVLAAAIVALTVTFA